MIRPSSAAPTVPMPVVITISSPSVSVTLAPDDPRSLADTPGLRVLRRWTAARRLAALVECFDRPWLDGPISREDRRDDDDLHPGAALLPKGSEPRPDPVDGAAMCAGGLDLLPPPTDQEAK